MTDCEKLARLIFKAGQVWKTPDDIVNGLLEGLTERSGRFGTSDRNYRVGVYKNDPYYADGFSDDGFLPLYQDPDPSSNNQVRHFAGWFGAGYLVPAAIARSRLYREEDTHDPHNPDVALGLAAISMGNSFQGDYEKLAQDFWHTICGGTSHLKFK